MSKEVITISVNKLSRENLKILLGYCSDESLNMALKNKSKIAKIKQFLHVFKSHPSLSVFFHYDFSNEEHEVFSKVISRYAKLIDIRSEIAERKDYE